MNDSIKLAEFLSNNNRLLPEEKGNFSSQEKFIYNDIKQHYYLYYNKERYIFVYPRNVKNELLSNYLIKRTLKSADEIKIAVTCSEEIKKNTFNSMLSNVLKILEIDILNHYTELNGKIIFLPLSIKESSKYIIDINKLENYFYEKFSKFGNSSNITALLMNIDGDFIKLTNKEQLEYLLIAPFLERHVKNLTFEMFILSKNPQRILESNYLSTSNNFLKIHTTITDENLKLLNNKFDLLKINLNQSSSMDISSPKGVLIYLNLIKEFYKKTSINEPKYDLLIEKFIDNNFCDNEEHEIVRLICFMKYIGDDTYSKALKFISESDLTVDYLQGEIEWFNNLITMYKNEINKNEIQIPYKLYEEISKIDGEKQEILKQVFFTVNNLFNSKLFHLCSPLDNGTYKLHIKGKLLIFSQILYKNYCPGKVTWIELLALEKIIINEDLISNEIKKVIIIAPIWEIIQNRIINLDGASEYNNLVS